MIEDNAQTRLALLNICRGDVKAAKEAMEWLNAAPCYEAMPLHVDHAFQRWAWDGHPISRH